MNSSTDTQQPPPPVAHGPIQIPILTLLKTIWHRRLFVAKIAGIGFLFASIFAIATHNEYRSTAELMPPDAQSLSGSSTFSALSMLSGSGAGLPMGLLGGSLGGKTPGGMAIGILSSHRAENALINRFNLKKVYGCKLDDDARKILADHTSFDEDKKSGIISISVLDRDPSRARDMAEAYTEELNELVSSVSTSSARRERVFLEQRVKAIKEDLNASTVALSQFSSRNATLDLPKQGEATVEEAGRLQGELIAAKSELSGLKSMYTNDNVRVKQVQGRISELETQLRMMSGEGEHVDATDLKANQLFPSVRKLPLLGVQFADLQRQVTMDQTLYEILTKQYELARIEEARDIPAVKVLDVPEVPERKASPHRVIMLAVGTLLFGFGAILWVVSGSIRTIILEASKSKEKGSDMASGIRRTA